MNMKIKIAFGAVIVLAFGLLGAMYVMEGARAEEYRKELRAVNGKLAEIESEVYCNAKWIKSLQEDTTDADAIKVLDERIAKYEYNRAEDIEEIKALVDALKASQTDAKPEDDISVPTPAEKPSVSEYEAPTGGLTQAGGVYWYGDQKETWYNLPMEGVIAQAQNNGIYGEYWVRDDGVKMYGDYIILACNRSVHPMGSLVETSLGTGISLDTGAFASANPTQVDIAVDWAR